MPDLTAGISVPQAENIVRDALEDELRKRDENLNAEIPSEVAGFDDDLFKRICNELGRQGELDVPKRTTYLKLEVRAGEPVRVLSAECDE